MERAASLDFTRNLQSTDAKERGLKEVCESLNKDLFNDIEMMALVMQHDM